MPPPAPEPVLPTKVATPVALSMVYSLPPKPAAFDPMPNRVFVPGCSARSPMLMPRATHAVGDGADGGQQGPRGGVDPDQRAPAAATLDGGAEQHAARRVERHARQAA